MYLTNLAYYHRLVTKFEGSEISTPIGVGKWSGKLKIVRFNEILAMINFTR